MQIIGNILNLSKIEAGYQDRYPERFDLTDLFDELKVLAANQNSNPDVMLLCENPHVHCYVQLDKKRFSQVMFNYLTNAIKYTPCGTIRFGYECRDGGIRLYVADTGIGISEANQSRVYQRFDKFDDFAQGTGLGLAIAKALTEAAGGHVGFESHEGKGSIFWSWVPCEISYD
nr:HAMP domain-containing sensor histidine kinase [Parabacteroides johnsonii]